MSGILGIWNTNGQLIEHDWLARMNAQMAHRGPDGQGIWIRGEIGFASQILKITPESLNESQPLINSSGLVLVWDGRLDNREDLLTTLKGLPGITINSPDSILVLATYERFGEKFPEHLAGDFALGLFDPNRKQLMLARDVIGIRPLYYCQTGKIFIFASEIKALLAHPLVVTRPNDKVLAEVVLNGSMRQNQNETCFEGIYSLPPASVAILNFRGLISRRYWDFDPSKQLRLKSFSEYAEAFREHFEIAVRRRLRSFYPVAVSVSGGLDSSSIFCLAETIRQREPDRYPLVNGFSYISPDGAPSDEKAFLLEIERDFDVNINRLPSSQSVFVNGARNEVWHVESPFLSLECDTNHKFYCDIGQSGARVLLTGHWGDQILFDQKYLSDLFYQLAFFKIWTHLKEYSYWNPDVAPQLYRRTFMQDVLRQYLPKSLLKSLRGIRLKLRPTKEGDLGYTPKFRNRLNQNDAYQIISNESLASAHSKSLYDKIRSSYYVACMEWNNKVASRHGLEVAFCFLDRDLISFLMSIPGEIQTWKGQHKGLLRESMRRILPPAIAERRGKADFTEAVNLAAELGYSQLIQCLEDGQMTSQFGYTEKDALNMRLIRLKSMLHSQDNLSARSLKDLLGLELWLQVFFNDKTSEKENLTYAKAKQA